MMDLSQFSTEDLQAMRSGDMTQVSTPGLQLLRAQTAHDSAAADTAAWAAHINPTDGMSFMDKFNAGAGKAFSDLGQGVKQKLGLASNADVQETRSLDAPLMKTGAAKAGNIGANVAMLAPAALVPGAATVPGAAVIGGIVGAMQPSASTGEAFLNTGLGAAGGAAGQGIANKAAGTVAFQEGQNAAKAAQGSQRAAMAQKAADAGLVIPPEDVGGGLFTKLLSGLGGKIKTEQVASQQNQAPINAIAKAAIGLPEDAPVSTGVLASIRKEAGQAYDAVANAGVITPTPAYDKALDDIAAPAVKAAAGFPNAKPNPIISMVDELRSPQFDASSAVAKISELRARADTAYAAQDKTMGAALKKAADALEGAIDTHLVASGAPSDVLQNFRDARQLMAKTYDVGRALNPATGDISLPVLAARLKAGKLPPGDLADLAEIGTAFPKATQALKQAPTTYSPLDMAYALRNVTTGNVKGVLADLGTLGVRPAARSVMLSGPMQRNMLASAGQPQPANAIARPLANNDALLPFGIGGGVAAGNALSNLAR